MIIISNVVDKIRVNISDQDSVGYSDKEILQWINDGYGFIRKILMQRKASLLYKIEKGEGDIFLSEFPMKIHKVRYEGDELLFMPDIPADKEGTPTHYYRIGETIHLHPKEKKDGKWEVIYIPEQEIYDMDTKSLLPRDFESILIEYATIRAQYRNEFQMVQEEGLLSSLTQQAIRLLVDMDDTYSCIKGYWS